MTAEPFVSYAGNGEDVVLVRALGHLQTGRFVEVGPAATGDGANLRALQQRGWDAVVVAPDQVKAAPGGLDSVLADAGWDGADIHVMLLGGADRDLLETVDLGRWRPWVLVVGSDDGQPSGPMSSSRISDARYRTRLFDGMSTFFVAAEHDEDVGPALSYPACPRDRYIPATVLRLESDLTQARARADKALDSALGWRRRAMQTWADASTGSRADRAELEALRTHAEALEFELAQIRRTLSWRVTAPLRGVRRRGRELERVDA